MIKKPLAITAALGLMFTAATAPAEAYHGSPKRTHHTSAKHVDKHGKWHGKWHSGHVSPARAKHWRTYGVHIRGGFPPNCRHLEHRAYLTGNAYWRYAANSCRHDVYKYY
jgi:hypothetical protein